MPPSPQSTKNCQWAPLFGVQKRISTPEHEERLNTNVKKYKNLGKTSFSSEVVSPLHEGWGLPFIVLKSHFYILILLSDLSYILLEPCTKMSNVITKFAWSPQCITRLLIVHNTTAYLYCYSIDLVRVELFQFHKSLTKFQFSGFGAPIWASPLRFPNRLLSPKSLVPETIQKLMECASLQGLFPLKVISQ
jgi:hypothetical protein